MLADRRVSPIGELPMGASGVPAATGVNVRFCRWSRDLPMSASLISFQWWWRRAARVEQG